MKKIVWTIFGIFLLGMVNVGLAGNHGYRTYEYPSRIVVRDKVVEYDPDRFLGYYGYYQLGEHLKEKSEDARKTEQELRLQVLEKQIEYLNLKLKEAGGEKSSDTPEPSEPSDGGPKADKYPELTKLFTNKCMACHKQNSVDFPLLKDGVVNPDLNLLGVDLVEAITYYDSHAKDAGLTRMPKGAGPLSDSEMSLIRKWRQDKISEALESEGR